MSPTDIQIRKARDARQRMHRTTEMHFSDNAGLLIIQNGRNHFVAFDRDGKFVEDKKIRN